MKIRPILIFCIVCGLFLINILPEEGLKMIPPILKVILISFIITFVIELIWRFLFPEKKRIEE
ncbi:hypothetical protein CBW65_19540 [Tumebacillus avium]|uniref:Uncharacterized protein n=1 Tax=Tumebacillus avium TaxID=1903704 RepID=A0A1Y0IQR4_9BACL|nr:hypothetical protein CBW65_19540 [Tumebacillus avium]